MNVQQLHTSAATPPLYLIADAAREPASSIQDVVLKHLKTEAEIASVLHLRDEIDLSVHAAAGLEQFAMLEKKEMKLGLSMPSISMVKSSARFGSYRLAIN